MNFIDTHAHLYLKEFDEDRDLMVQRALSSKVEKIILPNIDLATLDSVISLSDKYKNICYASIGLHPCDVKSDYLDVLNSLQKKIYDPQFIAIGESGTDAYWDKTFWNEQVDAFSKQISWSKELSKPIIIHSRETLDENIALIKKHQDGQLKGVFHCFTGTDLQAKQIIDLGFYLGIGGVVTYKNSNLKDVLSDTLLDHIILETDAPFLTPVPFRGKRNESSYIPIIAEKLADILQMPLKEIANRTSCNAFKLFNLEL